MHLRPANDKEREAFRLFERTYEAEVAKLRPGDFVGLGRMIDKMEATIRRYGWKSGPNGELLIDESIVFQDIRKANPQSDILETSTDEMLVSGWQETKTLFDRLTLKKGRELDQERIRSKPPGSYPSKRYE